MSVTIKSRIISDLLILDVAGKFDIGEETLRQSVKTFLAEGRQHFLVSLVDVPYLGSWGITEIISAWKAIRSGSGTMALLAPAKTARDVLQFTKLDTVFAIYKNETEALQHFAKSSRL